jgi:hypothetical protein
MNEATAAVDQLIRNYCEGIYRGDVALLRETFHPRAMLFGEVKGAPYLKTVGEYLEVVAGRPSPESLGETFAMQTESVEIVGDIATAKIKCPIFEYTYADRLSFVRHDGRWWIAAKLFTHIGG